MPVLSRLVCQIYFCPLLTQLSKINSTPPDLTLSLPFRSLEFKALGIMEDLQPGWDQSEASLNCDSITGEFLLSGGS